MKHYSIPCLQNLEAQINKVIKEARSKGQNVILEKSKKNILVKIDKIDKPQHIVVKQYAKRKYSSPEEAIQKFYNGMKEGNEGDFYNKISEFEFEKFWIIIFEKRR